MTPQFTESVQTALEKAFSYAEEHLHTEVGPNHLLLGFLADPQGYFVTLSHGLGLKVETLKPQVEKALSSTAKFTGTPQSPAVSSSLQQLLAQVQSLAKKWGDTYLSSDHFFYGFWLSSLEPFTSWKKKLPSQCKRTRRADQKNTRKYSHGLPHSRSWSSGPGKIL